VTLKAPPRASAINLLTTLVVRGMETDGLTEAEADLAVKVALGLVSDTEAPTSSPTGTPTDTTMSPTLDVDSDLPQCLSGCPAALLAPLEVRARSRCRPPSCPLLSSPLLPCETGAQLRSEGCGAAGWAVNGTYAASL
jgi:hypothetical protein